MELSFDRCQHCGCPAIKITSWQEKTFIAAQCRACGARGPVRIVLAANDFDAVSRLAADDWNRRINPEHLTDDEIASLVDRAVSLGQEAAKLGQEEEKAAQPNTSPTPSAPASQNTPEASDKVTPGQGASTPVGKPDRKKPPAKAGAGKGKGSTKPVNKQQTNTETNTLRNDTRLRLRLFLDGHKVSVGKASKQFKLGTSIPALYNILAGKRWPSDATLINVMEALDKLEAPDLPAVASKKEAPQKTPAKTNGQTKSQGSSEPPDPGVDIDHDQPAAFIRQELQRWMRDHGFDLKKASEQLWISQEDLLRITAKVLPAEDQIIRLAAAIRPIRINQAALVKAARTASAAS